MSERGGEKEKEDGHVLRALARLKIAIDHMHNGVFRECFEFLYIHASTLFTRYIVK